MEKPDLRQLVNLYFLKNRPGAVYNKNLNHIHILATPELRATDDFERRQTLCRLYQSMWVISAEGRTSKGKAWACFKCLSIERRKLNPGQVSSLKTPVSDLQTSFL